MSVGQRWRVWAVTALLVTGGCADAGRPGAGEAAEPPGRRERETFEATAITEGGQPRPLVAGTRIRLTFDGDTIIADAGCNQLSGRVSFDDGQLTIVDLVTTDMFCGGGDLLDQETWLAAFLEDRPAWQRTGDELTLRTDTVEMRLAG